MIQFEDTRTLQVGDIMLQHTGWQDGKAVSATEWEVTKVHPNSIDLVCPNAVWGRHMRLKRSDFPLDYWSIKIGAEMQGELDKLNAALIKAKADFQSHIVVQGEKYCLCNQDGQGNDVGKCTQTYTRKGMIRYMRMLTVHMRVDDE